MKTTKVPKVQRCEFVHLFWCLVTLTLCCFTISIASSDGNDSDAEMAEPETPTRKRYCFVPLVLLFIISFLLVDVFPPLHPIQRLLSKTPVFLYLVQCSFDHAFAGAGKELCRLCCLLTLMATLISSMSSLIIYFPWVSHMLCVRMSESPKKKKLTPAQKVKFANTAKSVTPIKKFQKGAEVVIPM